MTWFMVDDNLALHQKVVVAGNEAMGLWVRAGSWCGQHLTDGFIPEHIVKLLGTRRQADKLVTAGLWRVVDGGWAFHDWHDKQLSREDVESKRKARAAAGALGGKASGESRRAKSKGDDGSKREASASSSVEPLSLPSPTKPSGSSNQREMPAAAPPRADDGFADFWAVYPRRQGKADALKAWRQRKCHTIAANVTAGAARYRDDPNRDPAYTKLPAGWIREGRWDDDPLPPRRPTNRVEADEQARRDRRNRWMAEAQAADQQQRLALVAPPERKEIDPWTA